jgi:Tol biopolymer transport system component
MTMRLGDRQTTQVVPRPRVGLILSARWTADASRLAYAQYDVPERGTPTSAIYVAAADGRDAQRLLGSEEPGNYYQAPVWTADGRQLYFLYSGGTLTEPIRRIERLEVATGERKAVLDELGQFDISPDGQWLALAHAPGGRPALSLVNLQNGDRTVLIPVGPFEVISSPRFDPTSKTLLFSGLSYATGARARPAPGLAAIFDRLLGVPAAHAHGPPEDLYTLPIMGGTPTRLTSLLLDDPVGAWAPDGNELAFLAAEYLAIMPVGGSEPTPIITPGAYGSVDWVR